jgi:tetraacyldisaccharide 4'-kinase
MPLDAPDFWYREPGALARVLAPVGRLYGWIAERKRARAEPYRSSLPIICIGNFTAGGGGKTPTAIALAGLLRELGERPAFLTRGYGGSVKGSVLVEANSSAAKIGDEPLLLAEHAPTAVSADRAAGARLIEELGDASVIVMDDGFQNPQLFKDFSLIVVDAGAGIGNGLVLPAGPLRAPLAGQIARADALLVIGDGSKAAALVSEFERAGKPVLKAAIVPRGDPRWLGVLPVIGFAGIARPEKFFATLMANGARLVERKSFRDHHRFTGKEATALIQEASAKACMLVTTEKDWARLPDDDKATPQSELKFRSRPFPIALQFEDEATLNTRLTASMARSRD